MCNTCDGEEIVQTTNSDAGGETRSGKLSRGLQVRVLPSVPKSVIVVSVAQLVEPRIVIPVVAGSNPVVHPTSFPFIP
jgi:hypothetical protein